MKKLTTAAFDRWARKQGITSSQLLKAIDDMSTGLAHAKELGKHLHQVRVAKGNRGASAGFRTYAMVVTGQRVIFLLGFQKTDADNLSRDVTDSWKAVSKAYADFSDEAIDKLITKGELIKIE